MVCFLSLISFYFLLLVIIMLTHSFRHLPSSLSPLTTTLFSSSMRRQFSQQSRRMINSCHLFSSSRLKVTAVDGKEGMKKEGKKKKGEKKGEGEVGAVVVPSAASVGSSLEEMKAAKLSKMKTLLSEGIEPFAYSFQPTTTAANLHERFQWLGKGQEDTSGEEVVVAGRILLRRFFGQLAFFTLQDESGTIQLYLEKNRLGEKSFTQIRDLSDSGDLMGVKGKMKRTDKGELSIALTNWTLLTKSLAPLPDKYHGLTDISKRYRQRYLDMIVNPTTRQTLLTRQKLISKTRAFLDQKGFLEMETPILTSQCGGAEAKPFLTYHNSLDQQFSLRIATELHLKRLVIGGFPRVYEIGKIFRNEGISPRHNPEFTSVELYQAYADCEDMIVLTEDLLAFLTKELLGNTEEIIYQNEKISLSRPFRRISMNDIVKEKTGIDCYPYILEVAKLQEKLNQLEEEGKADLENTSERIRQKEILNEVKNLVKERSLVSFDQVDQKESVGELLNLIFEEHCEKTLHHPTFITEHPIDISPLAKKHRSKPGLTERFELFILGREYANAFSELTDPIDQRRRFQIQVNPSS